MTGQDVFNLAVDLMRMSAGAISDNDTKKYKFKVPSILSILQAEILKAENSSTEPVIITDLTVPLLIKNSSAIKIAPYGLAAHLAMQDGLDSANYFNSRYEELLRKVPKTPIPIVDVYNLSGGDE